MKAHLCAILNALHYHYYYHWVSGSFKSVFFCQGNLKQCKTNKLSFNLNWSHVILFSNITPRVHTLDETLLKWTTTTIFRNEHQNSRYFDHNLVHVLGPSHWSMRSSTYASFWRSPMETYVQALQCHFNLITWLMINKWRHKTLFTIYNPQWHIDPQSESWRPLWLSHGWLGSYNYKCIHTLDPIINIITTHCPF